MEDMHQFLINVVNFNNGDTIGYYRDNYAHCLMCLKILKHELKPTERFLFERQEQMRKDDLRLKKYHEARMKALIEYEKALAEREQSLAEREQQLAEGEKQLADARDKINIQSDISEIFQLAKKTTKGIFSLNISA